MRMLRWLLFVPLAAVLILGPGGVRHDASAAPA